MKIAPALTIVAAALFLIAADDTAKKDRERLQGSWETTTAVYDGRDLTADGIKLRFTFKGDIASLDGSEDVIKDYSKLSFKLDPAASPKGIDIKVTAGAQKDTVIEAIYELKGDELRVCAKMIGKERPTKFEAPEGSNNALLVLKRVKL